MEQDRDVMEGTQVGRAFYPHQAIEAEGARGGAANAILDAEAIAARR